MAKKSAGLLLYRFSGLLQVLLVHHGGPFWAKKDVGAWTIPKGEFDDSENPLQAAKRETFEETGIEITEADELFLPLNSVKQNSGKMVCAWALEWNHELPVIKSNLFQMEWPPRSGKIQFFPEVDKAQWLSVDEAKIKIVPGQVPIIEDLEKRIQQSQ
jgi:predicted NUDIX family NTP pyrophosphohydrolase